MKKNVNPEYERENELFRKGKLAGMPAQPKYITDLLLHPEINFLDARNPSSPFAYQKMMGISAWDFIEKNATPDGGLWNIKINDGVKDYYYFEKSKQDMFNSIKHHFGIKDSHEEQGFHAQGVLQPNETFKHHI